MGLLRGIAHSPCSPPGVGTGLYACVCVYAFFLGKESVGLVKFSEAGGLGDGAASASRPRRGAEQSHNAGQPVSLFPEGMITVSHCFQGKGSATH